MAGKFLIDGVDVREAYGVTPIKGCMASILAFPPTKGVPTETYQEADGVTADLSELYLDRKEVTLSLAVSSDVTYGKLITFYDFLTSKPYHEFTFMEYGVERRMRLIGGTSVDYARTLSLITLRLSDDDPIQSLPESDAEAESYLFPSDEAMLDGKRLTDYGVRLLKGTVGSLLTLGNLATGLLVTNGSMHGAEGDGWARVLRGAKDVTLNCLMTAKDMPEMLNNLSCLLRDLVGVNKDAPATKECQRRISIFNDEWVECNLDGYYKKMAVSAFFPDLGHYWLQFSLTFSLTKAEFVDSDRLVVDFETMNLYGRKASGAPTDYRVDENGNLYKD